MIFAQKSLKNVILSKIGENGPGSAENSTFYKKHAFFSTFFCKFSSVSFFSEKFTLFLRVFTTFSAYFL